MEKYTNNTVFFWSLKLINLRMRLGTNFFNITLKKLVLSVISN